METVAFGVLLFFGLLNLWVFHRFKKPLLPLVLAFAAWGAWMVFLVAMLIIRLRESLPG